jgi:hypothetical protein
MALQSGAPEVPAEAALQVTFKKVYMQYCMVEYQKY